MDVLGAYRRRIRTYRGVSGVSGHSRSIRTYRSCQDTPIRQLEYRVRIARESPNLGNPGIKVMNHEISYYEFMNFKSFTIYNVQ
jgi:hypothetical protein